MKREHRHHGMVRSYDTSLPLDPRPNLRRAKVAISPPTAGDFIKVSNKLTNDSKFTTIGRLRCKSKDKVYKGEHKITCSPLYDERSIAWREVGSSPSLKFSGFSGTSILDYLTNGDLYVEDDDDDDDDIDVDEL